MSSSSSQASWAAAEAVARGAYGRLVGYLAARTRDIAAAEDALSEAFVAALRQWPLEGVPDRPEAWLLTVARRRALDEARRSTTRAAVSDTLAANGAALDAAEAEAETDGPFPDERLALLFACAHPSVPPSVRTPLVLQAVLGVEAQRIASAFVVSPSAMAQRLVRAKRRLRDAGIAFRVPDPSLWPERVAVVLEAVYAAYSLGWDRTADAGTAAPPGIEAEALELARLLAHLLPDEPEARGLLALVAHAEARRPARRSITGAFVPLDEQDVTVWNRALQQEAEHALAEAARVRSALAPALTTLPGRYQLEAAIQSVHAARAATGETDWNTLALLYEGLVRVAPTVGAWVGRAAALGRGRGAAAGLAALDRVPEALREGYAPFWATRAHLLAEVGRTAEATGAYRRAAGLVEDAAARAYLLARAEGVA